jgi:hypothetical protein
MFQTGKQLAALGFLLFLVLWVAGVARSFTLPEPERLTITSPVLISAEQNPSYQRTASNLAQIGLLKTPLPHVLDKGDVGQIQVHEKTAHITSGTTAFDDDGRRLRKAIESQQATVFSEKATGVAPARSIVLGIGIHPDRFDALKDEFSGVGQIHSIDVQQQDRTPEFRRLYAQRQSLKKHQEAILKLRGDGKLSVEEALKVEQKIQEIEKEIQTLSVQLGDLLGKEPSYNLFVTLQEQQPGGRLDRSFTIARRLGGGFVWALGWWSLAALGVGLAMATNLSVRTLRPVLSVLSFGTKGPVI